MRGWKLHYRGRDHVYRFPNGVLRPGDYLRVHTGSGETGAGSGCNGSCLVLRPVLRTVRVVWGNRTDTATIRDRDDEIVDRCPYGKSAKNPKEC